MRNYLNERIKTFSLSEQDRNAVQAFKKKYAIQVKNVNKISKITFFLPRGIDEDEFENFDTIDGIMADLKKIYPGSIVTHDYDKFTVEEL